MDKHFSGELEQMQALPLALKVEMSKRRIREWLDAVDGRAYISFSGGKDSTVLLNLVRQVDSSIPAVFCDTGLEYPEIRDFVKSFDNVVWLKPKMNFRRVIQVYGYPVVSKEVSQMIYEVRHYNLSPGLRAKRLGDGSFSIPQKWRFLIDAPFEVSHQCCAIMKKRPFHQYEKETGRAGIVATMACESSLRRQSWLRYGCNAFDCKRPLSRPLSFWTEQDVLEYLYLHHLPYASVYGDIVFDGSRFCFFTTGVERTGCMFCMYGCHCDDSPNRFQRLAVTHPLQYDFCMKSFESGGLGLASVLDFVGIPYE